MNTPEPFGYFKAEPFGWTDCAETDGDAIPLFDKAAIHLIQKQRDELLAALEASRNALDIANNMNNGPICDTIWMPSLCPETLFDFMDAAIASVKGQK
jgi:hypothetical protein